MTLRSIVIFIAKQSLFERNGPKRHLEGTGHLQKLRTIIGLYKEDLIKAFLYLISG